MRKESKCKFDFIKALQTVFGEKLSAIILRLLFFAFVLYRIDIFLCFWKGILGVLIPAVIVFALMKISDRNTHKMIDDTYDLLAKRYEKEYSGEEKGVFFKLSKAAEYKNKNFYVINKKEEKVSIFGKVLFFQKHYNKEDMGLSNISVFEKEFKADNLLKGQGKEFILENTPRWVDSFKVEAQIVVEKMESEISCVSKPNYTLDNLTPIFELSKMYAKFGGYRMYWLKEHENVRTFKSFLRFYWSPKTFGYSRFSKERVKDFFSRSLFKALVISIILIIIIVSYLVLTDFISFLWFIGRIINDILLSFLDGQF